MYSERLDRRSLSFSESNTNCFPRATALLILRFLFRKRKMNNVIARGKRITSLPAAFRKAVTVTVTVTAFYTDARIEPYN